jgi:hypothetical protein
MTRRWLVRAMFLLLATLALANSGCLGLVIGGAAGGAAAGYALYEGGKMDRNYPATLDNAAVAVHTALGELGLSITKETHDDNSMMIDSRTTDDTRIRIEMKSVLSPIPADGPTTRISVRVGVMLGDSELSTRIHEQISLHLIAPVQMRMTPAPVAVPAPSASVPAPPKETAPPPPAK